MKDAAAKPDLFNGPPALFRFSEPGYITAMPELAVLIAAVAVLGYALFSRRLEASPLSAPILFTLVGLAIGPLGFGFIQDRNRDLLEVVATATLALVLFEDAASIRFERRREERGLMRAITIRLLALGLPLSVILGGAAAWAMFPSMGLISALIIAIVLVPTDAALSQPVFAARDLPAPVRNALDAESGLNDGLGLPLLFAALAIQLKGIDMLSGSEWGRVFLLTLALSPVAGAAVGFIGALALRHSHGKQVVSDSWHALMILALAALAFIGAELFGGNGFISVWAAGLVFGLKVPRPMVTPLSRFALAEGQLLIQATFILFGAMILPAALADAGWSYLIYAVFALTIMRMLPVVAVLGGLGLSPATKLFIAWFGPRGIPSILYLIIVAGTEGFEMPDMIVDIAACTVLLSILAHGASANWCVSAYRRALEKRPFAEAASRDERSA